MQPSSIPNQPHQSKISALIPGCDQRREDATLKKPWEVSEKTCRGCPPYGRTRPPPTRSRTQLHPSATASPRHLSAAQRRGAEGSARGATVPLAGSAAEHSPRSTAEQRFGLTGTSREGKRAGPCGVGTHRRAFRAQPMTVNHVFA